MLLAKNQNGLDLKTIPSFIVNFPALRPSGDLLAILGIVLGSSSWKTKNC